MLPRYGIYRSWIQEILILKGENSSKMELAKKFRIWKLKGD